MFGQTFHVGTTKAIYVRDRDAELWERAEAYAAARRLPMSSLVMNALEAYLEDAER
jgi:hypothetical protein